MSSASAAYSQCKTGDTICGKFRGYFCSLNRSDHLWGLTSLTLVRATSSVFVWRWKINSARQLSKNISIDCITICATLSTLTVKTDVSLCTFPVCRDPSVRTGGDRRARLPACQLSGNSGLHFTAALLPREGRSYPSKVKDHYQEDTAWHWW